MLTRLLTSARHEALQRAVSGLLDLLYPPRCVACGALGSWFCAACARAVARLEPPWCEHCGRPLAGGGICSACRNTPSSLEGLRALGWHQPPLQAAIWALKYEGVRVLAEPLGELLAEAWRRTSIPTDVLVPVPLHPLRTRQRGYNQSLLLARALSRRIGIRCEEGTLRRSRNTRSQVGLDIDERHQNVAGAFHCDEGAFAGACVLLIDDVCTTGATLEACADALLASGAREVWALTLARAVSQRDLI